MFAQIPDAQRAGSFAKQHVALHNAGPKRGRIPIERQFQPQKFDLLFPMFERNGRQVFNGVISSEQRVKRIPAFTRKRIFQLFMA